MSHEAKPIGLRHYKAVYRYFGNERISEANILAGHFASTRDRFVTRESDRALVLHDTTEFSYRHEKTELIGNLKKIATPITFLITKAQRRLSV
jgi:hypothetical protein